MEKPITQSQKWQELQSNLNEKSFLEKAEDFYYLAIEKSTPAGKYLYLPYGPVAKDKNSLKKAIKSLEDLAKKEKAIFVRIEPQLEDAREVLPKNAKKVKDIEPKDTWVLDLTPEKTTLISNFSQGTRTRYNTYAKKGLSVETTRELSEISHLVRLQNQLYQKKHLNAFSEEYLKAELAQSFSTLYLVKYQKPEGVEDENLPSDGEVIAASLFFDYENTRYYMQSAANTEFKKLPATVALLTSAIFDAKEKGIKNFDFWGIAPEGADKSHPWYGFTEFKKSFGGHEVHYAGTYDIVEKPFKYHLYTFLRKLHH